MVFWWVPYLAKGPRPDFNNGPGDDSNCGRILGPGVYSSPTLIMAPLQAIPILVRFRRHFCSDAHLWSHGECNIWPRAPGLTLIIVHGII